MSKTTRLRSLAAAALLAAAAPAQQVLHTVDEALQLAFGEDAAVERTTEVLCEQERQRVAEQAGVDGPGAVVFPYVARRDGEIVGRAYFDTHRVRTLREVVMVAVTPSGQVAKVMVCAFGEPLDYLVKDTFYAQFQGKELGDGLRLQRGIDGVSGATLTTKAAIGCVRRVLALDRLLRRRAPAPPPPAPRPEPPEPAPAPSEEPRPRRRGGAE